MNAEAKAIKAWKAAHADCYDVTTLNPRGSGQYLANRLDRAFLDGLAVGREIERAEIEARLLAVVRGTR
jgi:hypothetical protein